MLRPSIRFLFGVILAICGGAVAYYFTANLWLCLAVFVGCLAVWGILANLVHPRWYRR